MALFWAHIIESRLMGPMGSLSELLVSPSVFVVLCIIITFMLFKENLYVALAFASVGFVYLHALPIGSATQMLP